MMNRLIKAISDTDRHKRVRRAVLGLGFVAVDVEGSGIGLSANISAERPSSCTAFPRAGSIRGASAGDVLDLGFEPDTLSRSLSLATVNALSNARCEAEKADVFDKIAIRDGERVVMVGNMVPVARMLKQRGAHVDVFDNRNPADGGVPPDEAMSGCLKNVDIAILTATTLINASLEGILGMLTKAREVVLMGPSTAMVPSLFSQTPVTYLAGCRIVDEDMVFDIIMEGGGTEVLYRKGAMKKIIREVR